ncbi:hypothetical protein J6590_035478 [Homalodisca vitripennis]|nr:hypothetical protein J6590_035478 [Homalodisca vitripennis]
MRSFYRCEQVSNIPEGAAGAGPGPDMSRELFRKGLVNKAGQEFFAGRVAKVARNHESAVHAELRRQQQAQRKSVLNAVETPLQAQVRSESRAALQAARRAIKTPEQSQSGGYGGYRKIDLTESSKVERLDGQLLLGWAIAA